MLGLIAAAGAVTFAQNPASDVIALAPLLAFCTAAAASPMMFQATRLTRFWHARMPPTSQALADSLIFPLIAFGTVFPMIAGRQFPAKVVGGTVWSWVVFREATHRPRSAVHRNGGLAYCITANWGRATHDWKTANSQFAIASV